jgi:kynureninase
VIPPDPDPEPSLPPLAATLDAARTQALELDAADLLGGLRSRFRLPRDADGRPRTYLAGQSLGAQPLATGSAIRRELDQWADDGVDGWFHERSPWIGFEGRLRDATARLVGARPTEVTTGNALSINLHLLLASFFRPGGVRTRILVDAPTFPSDRYVVTSQLRLHGLDPATELVVVGPRDGEDVVRHEDIEAAIQADGYRLAVVLLAGVSYATGQRLDVERLTRATHDVGAVAVWDLAHAVGNVPLALHDWDVDAAAWCTYKYLNAGPGAPGQLFVHERHASDSSMPRLEGWWGNAEDTRFRMATGIDPAPGADAWRVSTVPVLGAAAVAAGLEVFEDVGLPALRARSLALTGFLESLVDRFVPSASILTPRDPAQRGCQLSLRFPDARRRLETLEARGIVADFREPDIVRLAPVPAYTSFLDCWTAAAALAD